MTKAEEALERIRREGRELSALRRMDPIARYRHLMDGIDGPFPDQEAIRRSLRPQDNQGKFLGTFLVNYSTPRQCHRRSQIYSRLLADFPSVGVGIILTVRFLEKRSF